MDIHQVETTPVTFVSTDGLLSFLIINNCRGNVKTWNSGLNKRTAEFTGCWGYFATTTVSSLAQRAVNAVSLKPPLQVIFFSERAVVVFQASTHTAGDKQELTTCSYLNSTPETTCPTSISLRSVHTCTHSEWSRWLLKGHFLAVWTASTFSRECVCVCVDCRSVGCVVVRQPAVLPLQRQHPGAHAG